MSRIKLFIFILGVAFLGLIGVFTLHNRHQDMSQQATLLFISANQAGIHCLDKLAGQQKAQPNAPFKAHIQECFLKNPKILVAGVSAPLCAYLARTDLSTFSTDFFTVRRISKDGATLTASDCSLENQLLFDFETTPKGESYYQAHRPATPEPDITIPGPTTAEPTIQNLLQTNASPDEILSALDKAAQQE